MLILCDFDGTISQPDCTDTIWDRFGRPDWREAILKPYLAGALSPVELMVAGYESVTAPLPEILDFVRPRIRLRNGFLEFRERCASLGWPLHVVSCGMDWYVKEILPPGIALHCLTAEHRGNWKVRLPDGMTLPKGKDFKVTVMESLRTQHPGMSVAFIGDGRNDIWGAQAAERAFAVQGSRLAKLCRAAGTPVTEFTDFGEVARALD